MPSQPNGYSRSNVRSTPSGMLGRQTPWKPSQPAMTVALELVLLAVVAVADARPLGLEVVHRDVGDLEVQRQPVVETRGDQVLDDLVLAVDHDAAAAGQLAQRDAVALAVEPQLDAVVDEPLALHALADARALSRSTVPCSSTPARIRCST